jgi:uncharacterized protein (TIGR01777 family)
VTTSSASVLVTGATGLLGRRVVRALGAVRVLTRDPASARRTLGEGVEAVAWAEGGALTPQALAGIETVVHLAGEPVAGRWTEEKKRRIRESRVEGTRRLVAAIAGASPRPGVLVAASAVGYYGDRGDELLDESSPPGKGFLADVCRAWEEQARAAEALGLRVVRVRIGVVLGREGGALRTMLPAFKLGLAGRLGSGRQWMSWIHVDDVVGLLLHAASERSIAGAMNAVAPAPVTNAEFTRALAAVLRRPAFLAAPAPVLRATLGGMAEVVLGSQRVAPRVAVETGYPFRFPALGPALRDVLGASGAPARAEPRP